MKYYSTNHTSEEVLPGKAVFGGLPPDNGLYMPETIPQLTSEELLIIRKGDLKETASLVLRSYFDDIPLNDLEGIIDSALDFPIPLVNIGSDLYSLELYHGPTMAFKDVGAGFLAGCLDHYSKNSDKKVKVLVATSGDTGSAVANGFYGKEGVEVVILFPSGKISKIQEQQMTTLGGNITALEVDGTFDDCQLMVKKAFLDTDLNGTLTLTSANSINIARFLAQSVYYFHAWSQLDDERPAVFSVPSGNFGNLTAGLIARRMGLPVYHFVASTNINKTFPDYLSSGVYRARPSIATLSNAMDVGDPSNFVRILDLFKNDINTMRSDISAFHFNDEETIDCISRAYREYGYLTDPHGAVGLLGLEEFDTEAPCIFLETAHPFKFREHVEKATGTKVDTPPQVLDLEERPSESVRMGNSFEEFKDFLVMSN